ncbi:AraC family transcriptional regulator [Bradyrhizobium liaoningense]|uniref:AraC family transcriptional regulator n=1 Tax=Bradyrhizobium liaoningense TaxID=43992 RepID=UPI001BA8146E|nr:AraC family transcriptional regulator [Bradyrhizobium liaoningense]MBR0713935.1 AraC family transcriptional regulator [Bradyrhizobium liaoningense]
MDVLGDWLRMFARPKYRLARSVTSGQWGFRLEAGSALAFHFIRKGSAWLRIAGRADTKLSEGDLVVLSDGPAHEVVDSPQTQADPVEIFAQRTFDLVNAGPATEIFCGQFRPDAIRGQIGAAALPPFVHLKAADIARDPGIAGLSALLTAELDGDRQGNEMLVERLADGLLIYVLRNAAAQAGHGTGWLSAMHDPRLARVFRAIHATPHSDWTVDDMAGEAGLSRAAFARRFTERVGKTPLGYLTAWRMTLAARRFEGGKLPLSVVANEVGYQSEAAFSRAFRKYHGVSPGKYR